VHGTQYAEFHPTIPTEQVYLLEVARALLVAHRQHRPEPRLPQSLVRDEGLEHRAHTTARAQHRHHTVRRYQRWRQIALLQQDH
jgi:hypothetical protein